MSVLSPCINICVIDDDFTPELCAGCYRTVEEITLWSKMADETKVEVIKLSEQRRLDSMRVVFK